MIARFLPMTNDARMTPTERQQRKRALDRAGFIYVSGHLPTWQARIVLRAIKDAEKKVEAVINTVDKPEG